MGHVVGADVSATAIDYCRQRGHAHLTRLAEGVPLSKQIPGPFGLVTILDVLEHVSDDCELLRQVMKVLADEGFVVITVPAYKFLWSGEDNVSCHLRRYTRTGVLDVLKKAGLTPVKVSYFGSFLFPLQVLVVLLNKLRPTSVDESYIRSLPHWLNTVLRRIMSLERLVLRCFNFPFGGSILCCAQRRHAAQPDARTRVADVVNVSPD